MTAISQDGLWKDVRGEAPAQPRPALFVDRDGTLIDLVPFLDDPARVALIAPAAAAIVAANAAGWAVVVVTNQSGVGRGYYGWDVFERVQERMLALLAAAGASIDATYACPHPPPGDGGPELSAYRKPAPGMLLRAAADLSLDLARSWVVGDSARDLEAGRAAGVGGGWLVATGYGSSSVERRRARGLATGAFEVEIDAPLADLAARIGNGAQS